MAALISSIVIVPRFSARAIIFFTDASFMSMSGASPSSVVSTSVASFFAMLPPLFAAGECRQPLLDFLAREQQPALLLERILFALLQSLGRSCKGRADLPVRHQRIDRGPEVGHGTLGRRIATGEGKGHRTGPACSLHICCRSAGRQ